MRDAVRLVFQELIEAEAAEAVGAARYERSDSRVTERNGHRPRLLSTRAGDVELKIPKLRKGSFMPSLLEPRRRIDKALHAVVMEALRQGGLHPLGGRSGQVLGRGLGITESEVSRVCAELDEGRGAFRGRRLDHTEFPYVFLDRHLPQGPQQRRPGDVNGDGLLAPRSRGPRDGQRRLGVSLVDRA